MEKISKIQVKNEVYELADDRILTLTNSSDNFGKYFYIDGEGNLTAVEVQSAGVPATSDYEAEVNGEGVESLYNALLSGVIGTVKMLKDVTWEQPIILPETTNATLDMNGHKIISAITPGNTTLLSMEYGANLTITGHGTIDGNGCNAIGVFNKETTKSKENIALTIENGTFIGRYFALVGQGASTDNSTFITINGGKFVTTDYTNSIAFYHPQPNGTCIINGGEFIGTTGLEVRAGDIEINGGHFVGQGVFSAVPASGGAVTSGCGMAVVQHVTKLPININITDGLFQGFYAFYEANPQKNDAEAIAKTKGSITGGQFHTNDMVYGRSVYSEDWTKFVGANVLANMDVQAEYQL